MKRQLKEQESFGSKIKLYFTSHKVSPGLFLASYGAFYLSTFIMGGWSMQNWGETAITYPPFSINALLTPNLIALLFFGTSLPSLLIGTALLCKYCITSLDFDTVEDRELIAMLLTAFGFFYIIVGAWPLTRSIDFPWEWQKQIANNGLVFSWLLYSLSMIVFLVGSLSVYRCSKIYHQKHPEFALEE